MAVVLENAKHTARYTLAICRPCYWGPVVLGKPPNSPPHDFEKNQTTNVREASLDTTGKFIWTSVSYREIRVQITNRVVVV